MPELSQILIMLALIGATIWLLDAVRRNLPEAGLRYRVDETGAVRFPPFEDSPNMKNPSAETRGDGRFSGRGAYTHSNEDTFQRPRRSAK